MAEARVKAVAVGLLLGFQHHAAQGIRVHELLLPVFQHHAFKQVPGVDVADDLGDVLKLGLDKRQLLAMGFCLPDGRRHDHALVEGGRGLRHGHGVVPVQRTVGADALVVEGVSQLMGEGHDATEGAVEIGQDAALADALHPGAEGTAGFSVPGIEIDPAFVKGARHHVRQFLIEGRKQLHQNPLGVLRGILRRGFAHGREQVVPGQAVFMSQRLSLGAEVLPEFGHVFLHRPQHGVQGLPLHVGLLQRPVKGGPVAPELAVRDGFQLDGV